MPNEIFTEVSRRCGLAAMLAPGTVRRVLQQAGLDPDRAGPDAYLSILGPLSQRLAVYLGDAEPAERVRELRAFLHSLRAPAASMR